MIKYRHWTRALELYRDRQGGYIPTSQKRRMIRSARLRAIRSESGRHVHPCSGRRSLYSCFTIQGDRVILWYNDSAGFTHVIMEDR